MISVHAAPEEFKNATTTGHFEFVILEVNNIGQGNHLIIVKSSFSKSLFCSHEKRKAGVSKFLRFEECFSKSSVFVTD